MKVCMQVHRIGHMACMNMNIDGNYMVPVHLVEKTTRNSIDFLFNSNETIQFTYV